MVPRGTGGRARVIMLRRRAYQNFTTNIAAAALARFVTEFDGLRALYADYKRQAALLDFDDLLHHARDLLVRDPGVRQALARRYPRVLVDEFQDTDPLQAEILWMLCGEGAQSGPWTALRLRPGSLFLVGDPKQAVYRFRGADVDTYLEAKRALLAHDASMLRIGASQAPALRVTSSAQGCGRSDARAGAVAGRGSWIRIQRGLTRRPS